MLGGWGFYYIDSLPVVTYDFSNPFYQEILSTYLIPKFMYSDDYLEF